MNTETLNGQVAAVFAANGGVAQGVVRSLARQGATVCISGRDAQHVHALAETLATEGLLVKADPVDAQDEGAVRAYLAGVHQRHGRLDVVFNGIGIRAAEGGYAVPSTMLPMEQFLLPLQVHVGSQFLTAREAAPYLAKTQGCVVLLSASLAKDPAPCMAGVGAACGAVEALTRALAVEFAQQGIRVNCVAGGAMAETRTIQETSARNAANVGMDPEAFTHMLQQRIMTRRFPTVAEVASVATFLASPAASGLTGQILNASAGLVLL